MMKLNTRSARRSLAATAIVCSAVALPATALAVTGQASQARRHVALAVPRCRSFNTEVWLGLGGGGAAAGTTFYPLEFSNVGHRTCYLYGYPDVSAVSSSGRQIGQSASHAGRRRVVVLRPGATAHAILGIVQAGNIAGCQIRNGANLKVHAPSQRDGQIIANFTFMACSNKSVLRVDAVSPGTGIPGFTTS